MWLVACASSDPVVPLEARGLEVLAELDLAVELVRRKDPEAAVGVAAAYRKFEDELEPALRQRLPPEDVLRLEYGYARLAAAKDPDEAGDAGAALADAIRAATSTRPTLPEPP
jgi:hypothetical protein